MQLTTNEFLWLLMFVLSCIQLVCQLFIYFGRKARVK